MPCLAGCNSSSSPSSGPGGSDGSCSADGGSGSCTCPPVEIQINNTPTANDDLVGLKCEHPAHRSKVDCRVRATGAGAIRTIVLTNPDGRLRFPESGDTTLNITLPADNSWVTFKISGERGSNAIGDAVIEAHCQTAGGALLTKKPATVFWFDAAEIKVNVGGAYAIDGAGTFGAAGNAVNYAAKATIKPAGVDCSADQIKNLRVGMIQNEKTEVVREKNWDTPTIAWAPGAASGTIVNAPTTFRLTINLPRDVNDSEASVAPLYDQPGKAKTIDANSLQKPIGCAGGGAAATSSDNPSTPAPAQFRTTAKTDAGAAVGILTYNNLINVKIAMSFTIWVVIFDTSTSQLCALRQRDWNVHVDSSAAAAQKAVAGASDAAASSDPITAGRFANDEINDAANFTRGPVGAATTRFVKP